MMITLMATLQHLEATKEKEALTEEVQSPTFMVSVCLLCRSALIFVVRMCTSRAVQVS